MEIIIIGSETAYSIETPYFFHMASMMIEGPEEIAALLEVERQIALDNLETEGKGN